MKTSKNMNNQEIARLLRAVAAALEVKGENRFRIVAYQRAATSVEHATSEVKDLWDDNKLTSLPGVGANIAQHLDTLFKTGKVKHFEKIMSGLPEAMFEFLEIPEIGAKTALKLCKKLGITKAHSALKRLEEAARDGEIRDIEGFGEESERNILEGIREFKERTRRMPLPYAQELAKKMIAYLEECSFAKEVYPLGSLRRKAATVGDIDIVVATNAPQKVINHFVNFKDKKKVLEKGERKASLLLKNGEQIDLRVQEKASFGSLLQHFTGSKQHNIHLREIAMKRDLSLSEYGVKKKGKLIKFKDEKSFYNYLRMDWIPPELREDKGEIEAAQGKKLPNLVKLEDIRGDLHIHTSFNIETSHDLGKNSGLEIAKRAAEKGLNYIGFADHNPSTSQHNKEQIIGLIKRRSKYIEQIKATNKKIICEKSSCEKSNQAKLKKLFIFNGLEVDITPNGSLAVPNEGLELLDYVIASVHSSFRMSRDLMTNRVLKALEHPKVRILGHPTGRKLNKREGFEVDWDKIFAVCKKRNIFLEINAWPDRLDLPDVLVREAIKNGLKLVINTDAHALNDLDLMEYGVSVVRRGWAERRDIINTLSLEKLRAILL